MGIGKGFWDEMRPLARMEDLSFLRGKKLAIDLSYWLVQQQTALKDQYVRKPHLRLTFYRVVKLVAKVGALPVFVVDGEPPALKHGVRMKRFKRFADMDTSLLSEFLTSEETCGSRNGMFEENVEECVTLLDLLGMPVLRAQGEAESLCAALNREGLVDACVSPDSDALVHGAKCVIKSLQLENKNKGPEVELYRAVDLEMSMGLRRKHLVALALLVGCDYSPEGVPGVGCTSALRLLKCFVESEILDRLRAWGRGELSVQDEVEVEAVDNAAGNLSSVTHCSKCGHPGNKKEHTNSGCRECISSSTDVCDLTDCTPKHKDFRCSCPFCLQKAKKKREKRSNEWWAKICHKISTTPGFPDEEIISLFLTSEIATGEDISSYSSVIKWRVPSVEQLEIFLQNQLFWEPIYVRQKILPLFTHFYLTELAAMPTSAPTCNSKPLLLGAYAPLCIQRIKIEQGEPLYRLTWKSMKEGMDGQQWFGLKGESKRRRTGEVAGNDLEEVEPVEGEAEENGSCFTTDENMEVVKAACPDLVARLDTEQEEKHAARARVTKKKKVDTSLEKQSSILSFFKHEKQVRNTGTGCGKGSVEELSPHTPDKRLVGPGSKGSESLITSLNSKSGTTKFSLVSPAPIPGTPRRKVSKPVARRLSFEQSQT
ncbi:hypothetical protein R1flu_006807 [Riccia fluitans]|uniref:Flap endonuclease GEN-like 1 n=1 Tax=Riccia fluitans TaxID=41844 RepID=A0ABD1YX21_9MARC